MSTPKKPGRTKRVQILPKGWKIDYKDRKGVTHYVGPNNKTRTTPPPGTKYKNVKITPTKKKKKTKKRGKKYTVPSVSSVAFVNHGFLDDGDYVDAITLSEFWSPNFDLISARPIKAAIDLNIDLNYPLSYLPEIRGLVKGQILNNDTFLLYGQNVNDEKTVSEWVPGSTYVKGQRVAYLGEVYEAQSNISSSSTRPPVSFINNVQYLKISFPAGATFADSIVSIKRSGNSSWRLVGGQNGLYRYDQNSDMLKRVNVEGNLRSYANSYIYCEATGKAYVSDDLGEWDESDLSPERNPLKRVTIYGISEIYDFDGNPAFRLKDAQAGGEPPEWSPDEKYRGSYLSGADAEFGWVPGDLVTYANDVYACIADTWIEGISPDNDEYWQIANAPGATIESTGISAYKARIVTYDVELSAKVFASLRPAKRYNILSDPPQKPLSNAFFTINADTYRLDAASIINDPWLISKSYIVDDMVEYNGDPYVAVADSVGQNPATSASWSKTVRDVTTNSVYSSDSIITFEVETFGIDVDRVDWDFGDGVTASGASVTHKYMSGNTDVMQFDVTATVISNTGETFDTSQPILVERMDQIIVGLPIVVGAG